MSSDGARAAERRGRRSRRYAEGGPRFTTKVFSSDLKWLPQGEQEAFLADRPVRPVHADILLAKLRPGQALSLEAHGRKGVARDHAKFSPVATASYRMKPVVDVKAGPAAPPFAVARPASVFEGGGTAAARPRACVFCKQCEPLSEVSAHAEAFATRVELRRDADHFLFKVESVGQLEPLRIVRDAIAVLKGKTERWRGELELTGGQVTEGAPKVVEYTKREDPM